MHMERKIFIQLHTPHRSQLSFRMSGASRKLEVSLCRQSPSPEYRDLANPNENRNISRIRLRIGVL